MTDCNLETKVVMLGNTNVGKSTILRQYMQKDFDPNTPSTLGLLYFIKNLELLEKKFKLLIYDMAGQEKLRSIASIYYREAHIIFAVYSVEDQKSQDELDGWVNEVAAKNNGDYVMIVLGNKIDLKENQKLKISKKVESVCKKYHVEHFFVSAKTGKNIDVG